MRRRFWKEEEKIGNRWIGNKNIREDEEIEEIDILGEGFNERRVGKRIGLGKEKKENKLKRKKEGKIFIEMLIRKIGIDRINEERRLKDNNGKI